MKIINSDNEQQNGKKSSETVEDDFETITGQKADAAER